MPIIRNLLDAAQGGQRARLPRLNGTRTAAGVSVDAERSLQVSAVYACVRLITGAISQLPVDLYRKGNGRREVDEHPLLPLLVDRPNPDIDAGEFWQAMVGWMLLRGNGLAYREINGAGRTVGLWPIAPTSIQPKRTSRGQLAYEVRLHETEYVPGFTPNRARTVGRDRMLHFRAFGLGIWGLSPVTLARTKVGTAFAAEQYGAGFFARGANPGGVLKTDQELSDPQIERLEQQWRDVHEGFEKAHAPAILEGGLTWDSVGLPPGDAQFLETQKYTAATIAGHLYGVPPHMIGDVERSTSWGSGIAEQGIGFVRYTLMPWIVRLERVTRQLLPEPDLYLKFNTDALERGDIKSRYDAYAVGKNWGFLSTNDINELEDRPPVPGGDVYLQPLNMVPAGTFDDPERTEPHASGARSHQRDDEMRERHVELHRRALVHFFNEQRDQVLAEYEEGRTREFDRDESDRRLGRLLASLGLGAATEAASQVADRLSLSLDTGGFSSWMSTMGTNVARHLNDATFAAVAAAATTDEIRDVFITAAQIRAAQIAVSRVTEAFGFGRSEAAQQAGARTKTWVVTSTNPRSKHEAMDGETVPLGDVFSNGARWPGDTANLDTEDTAGCQCDLQINP